MAAKLVDLLDASEGDPDLEPDGSDEPSLGISSYCGQDDLELDTSDSEPWLGATEAGQHLEVIRRDPTGRALETALSDPLDQSRWASNTSDLEEDCEDEGAQCEDEGGQCEGGGHGEGEEDGGDATCQHFYDADHRKVWPPAAADPPKATPR
jgi:hypothetical protein